MPEPGLDSDGGEEGAEEGVAGRGFPPGEGGTPGDLPPGAAAPPFFPGVGAPEKPIQIGF